MLSVVILIALMTVIICISGNETIPRRVVVTRGRYRAAVFDQAPTFLKNTSQVLSRREAVKFLNETLTVYEEQCRKGRHLEVSSLLFCYTHVSASFVSSFVCLFQCFQMFTHLDWFLYRSTCIKLQQRNNRTT